MKTLDHFTRLFTYDDWANHEVLAGLRTAKEPPARSMKFIAHILAAERLWFDRLQQHDQTVLVWPEMTLEACESMASDLAKLWKSYLTASSDDHLATSVSYHNSKGEQWSSRVDDILTHVIMHSVYHRGQIAADMRNAGLTPAYTDFIHGVRQGFVE
jgi:uncharacterized damage-inducible protein DinB